MSNSIAVWPDGDWTSYLTPTLPAGYEVYTEGDGMYEKFMQSLCGEIVNDTEAQSRWYSGDRIPWEEV